MNTQKFIDQGFDVVINETHDNKLNVSLRRDNKYVILKVRKDIYINEPELVEHRLGRQWSLIHGERL